MQKLMLVPVLLLLATVARADSTTPTFEEVLAELALIGNDVTFYNVTPSTLQAVINAEIAEDFPGGYMTTSPEYEAQFFADGSAFLFQVPFGTVVTAGGSIGTVPEPATWLLLIIGLVLVLMRPQVGQYAGRAGRYRNAYAPRKWAA